MVNTDQIRKMSEIKESIKTEKEKRGTPQTIFDHLTNRALTDLESRLGVIADILSIEKYDLVFIGQVSVGKTTAICHMFELITEVRKKIKIGKKEREVDVVQALMATGAGYTTLCEVAIEQDDETFIEVESYSEAEVSKTIDDFCSAIWQKVFPEEFSGQADPGTLPPELMRAIRNMVKLPDRGTKDRDPAIELAKQYGNSSFRDFKAEVVRKASMSERIQKRIYPDQHMNNKKQWLMETFDKLNLVKLSSFSIPQHINIHIEPSIISVYSNKIGKIIDTKGVDAAQFNRQDLDTYIRARNNSICLFSEHFSSAPTNVIDIIERHMTKEARDISSKIVLFVMPRENQPENVVGPDGPIGDRDEGIFLRVRQIEEAFMGREIDFNSDNILIYDPLVFYESVNRYHRKGQDFEEEDIDAERRRIFDEIDQVIQNRVDYLWKEVLDKERLFAEIREGGGLDDTEEQLIRNAIPEITKLSHLDLANADRFFEEYRKPWFDQWHVMTLRATNNRFGEYPPRLIDICYDAKPVVEKLATKVASRRKDKVMEIVRNIQAQSSETSELQRLMPLLEERINEAYNSFIKELANKMVKHLSDDIFYPQDETNEFWLRVQDRYGKGPGYRDDVIAMYEEQMGDYETFLQRTAEELWEDVVIKKSLDFLS